MHNGLTVNSVYFSEQAVKLESAYCFLALYEKCSGYVSDNPEDNSTNAGTGELDEIKRK